MKGLGLMSERIYSIDNIKTALSPVLLKDGVWFMKNKIITENEKI